MDVLFLKKFSKDLDKIKKPKDLKSILEIIELVKQVQNFTEVPGTKKLKGYEDAFRRLPNWSVRFRRVGRVRKGCSPKRYLQNLSLTDKI